MVCSGLIISHIYEGKVHGNEARRMKQWSSALAKVTKVIWYRAAKLQGKNSLIRGNMLTQGPVKGENFTLSAKAVY